MWEGEWGGSCDFHLGEARKYGNVWQWLNVTLPFWCSTALARNTAERGWEAFILGTAYWRKEWELLFLLNTVTDLAWRVFPPEGDPSYPVQARGGVTSCMICSALQGMLQSISRMLSRWPTVRQTSLLQACAFSSRLIIVAKSKL